LQDSDSGINLTKPMAIRSQFMHLIQTTYKPTKHNKISQLKMIQMTRRGIEHASQHYSHLSNKRVGCN